MWRRLASAVLALALIGAGAAARAAEPAGPPSDAEIRRMLVTRVDVQKKAVGIVVGVTTPEGRRIIAYGARRIGGPPMDADTVIDVGSITKVFTALILADMARRGEVALDDPVSKVLPNSLVRLPVRDGRAITYADLATHTAGLPLRPDNLVSRDPDNKYDGYTTERLNAFLSSFKPPRPIGGAYEYSNVGYGLLGEALSARTGLTYGQLLQRRLAEPLALHDTGLELSPGMKARQATGYNTDLAPVPHWSMGALESAGGARSTANDLLALTEVFLGRRRSPLGAAARDMLAVRRPGGMQPSSEIALAWNILKVGDHEIAWKNGSVGGYRAFIGFDLKSGVGVVALANAQTDLGADDIGLNILGADIPVDLHVPRVHTEVAVAADVLQRYVGRYRFAPDDSILVTRTDGQLFVTPEPGTDRLPLFAEGERDFFMRVVDVEIRFEGPPGAPATVAIWRQGGAELRGERVP